MKIIYNETKYKKLLMLKTDRLVGLTKKLYGSDLLCSF